jgi:hypothetical protein
MLLLLPVGKHLDLGDYGCSTTICPLLVQQPTQPRLCRTTAAATAAAIIAVLAVLRVTAAAAAAAAAAAVLPAASWLLV